MGMTTTPNSLAEEVTMTDHEIAATVNHLRDIAKEYGQTQQLRDRIACVIVPLLSASKPAAPDVVKWPHEITRGHIECLIADHQRDGQKQLASRLNSSGSYLIRVAESFRWCLEQMDAAASAAPAQSGEPVAEVIKWRTLTGHTAWDFKVFDRTLEHGAKLYAAPQPAQTAQSVAAIRAKTLDSMLADIDSLLCDRMKADAHGTLAKALEKARNVRGMLTESFVVLDDEQTRPVLGDPDTTQYAQWAGEAFKFHSRDQIVEYANARVRAAFAQATATQAIYSLFSSSDRRNFGHLEPQAFVNAVIEAIRAQPVAQTAPLSCWSCKMPYTEQQRTDEDGDCHHCGAEIEEPAPPAQAERALTDEQLEDLQEAREILENMVRSVELDGNYSTEATCTFLRQALQCLPAAQPASGASHD